MTTRGITITHLATPAGALCWGPGGRMTQAADLNAVDCELCLKRLDRLTHVADTDWRERRHNAARIAAVEASGLLPVWDHLTGENASDNVMRGVVGALAQYLVETGYTLEQNPLARTG